MLMQYCGWFLLSFALSHHLYILVPVVYPKKEIRHEVEFDVSFLYEFLTSLLQIKVQNVDIIRTSNT